MFSFCQGTDAHPWNVLFCVVLCNLTTLTSVNSKHMFLYPSLDPLG